MSETNEMELANQEKIITHSENKSYKYLRILEADTIKHVEMKEKIKKEYLRWTRKLLEIKLYFRNFIKGLPILQDIRDHSWSGPEKNLNKWTTEQEN